MFGLVSPRSVAAPPDAGGAVGVVGASVAGGFFFVSSSATSVGALAGLGAVAAAQPTTPGGSVEEAGARMQERGRETKTSAQREIR